MREGLTAGGMEPLCVAFCSCARIWGECSTIHSPPALFFRSRVRRSANNLFRHMQPICMCLSTPHEKKKKKSKLYPQRFDLSSSICLLHENLGSQLIYRAQVSTGEGTLSSCPGYFSPAAFWSSLQRWLKTSSAHFRLSRCSQAVPAGF